MCIPLSPLQAIAGGGSAGKAVKSALFPIPALLGAFDKKKPKSDQRYGGGPNADGSTSIATMGGGG